MLNATLRGLPLALVMRFPMGRELPGLQILVHPQLPAGLYFGSPGTWNSPMSSLPSIVPLRRDHGQYVLPGLIGGQESHTQSWTFRLAVDRHPRLKTVPSCSRLLGTQNVALLGTESLQI